MISQVFRGVALLAVVAVAAAVGAPAATPQRQCRTGCTQAKKACFADAKTHFQALLGACTGTAPERRHCRKLAKAAVGTERKACRAALGPCRTCCAGGGVDCAASTTTTTSAPPTTSTSPAVSTTTPTSVTTTSVTTSTVPFECRFPATGQTDCWGADGKPIACAGSGHDGETRAGAPLAYVDNGDGTITDQNTGLTWEKLSYDGSVHDEFTTYSWHDAFAVHVATLNTTAFAGHADWRLPNVRELESIVDFGAAGPALAPDFNHDCSFGCSVLTCSCGAPFNTWSSTSNVAQPTTAWSVYFASGFVGVGGKSALYHVRAVRGTSPCLPATGQTTCWDAAGSSIPCAGTGQDGELHLGAPLDYVDNGDGTITDTVTKLMWEKQSRDHSINDVGNSYLWADAFTGHVATLNGAAFAGHADWRAPNVRELQSIIDYGNPSPAVAGIFADVDCMPSCTALQCSCTGQSYWSSTTNGDTAQNFASEAWYVLATRGDTASVGKDARDLVRAVRTLP